MHSMSLSGFWMVDGPKFLDVSAGLTTGIRIDYSATMDDRNICLIDDEGGSLTGICSAGVAKRGFGERDGNQVTVRWWSGPATMIFHGKLEDPRHLRGSVSGGVAGLSMTGAVPMTLSRLEPSAIADEVPMVTQKLRDAIDDIAQHHLTQGRYGEAAIDAVKTAIANPPWPEPSPDIGWLGRIHIRWQKKQPEKVQDVYRVGAPGAEKLCRIGLDDQGRIDDFDCRGLAG